MLLLSTPLSSEVPVVMLNQPIVKTWSRDCNYWALKDLIAGKRDTNTLPESQEIKIYIFS